MMATVPAAELHAEAARFAASRHATALPAAVRAITDRDSSVYLTRIAALAAAHGARLLFVFVPEFDATGFASRDFYARLGGVADFGDLARDPTLYQSFSHLNHRGAMVASDRLADRIAGVLGADGAIGNKVTGRADGGGA